jgi:hypothetical protein
MSATWTLEPSPRLRRPGIVAGIAVSLLLHVVLIFGYRFTAPTERKAAEAPPRTMMLWLRQPKPPAAVARVEPPPPPPKAAQMRKRDKTDIARNSAPAPAAPTPSAAPVQEQAVTLPAPASNVPDPFHQEEQPKNFDVNAALKTARKVANEKDPARAGTAVAQLDDHPLYPEQKDPKLARDIQKGSRPDCRQSQAGLLSPLFWLMDKKDSGCKWK